MIPARTGDLNGIEFVSHDVEWLEKKDASSGGWIDAGVKRHDWRMCAGRRPGIAATADMARDPAAALRPGFSSIRSSLDN